MFQIQDAEGGSILSDGDPAAAAAARAAEEEGRKVSNEFDCSTKGWLQLAAVGWGGGRLSGSSNMIGAGASALVPFVVQGKIVLMYARSMRFLNTDEKYHGNDQHDCRIRVRYMRRKRHSTPTGNCFCLHFYRFQHKGVKESSLLAGDAPTTAAAAAVEGGGEVSYSCDFCSTEGWLQVAGGGGSRVLAL